MNDVQTYDFHFHNFVFIPFISSTIDAKEPVIKEDKDYPGWVFQLHARVCVYFYTPHPNHLISLTLNFT